MSYYLSSVDSTLFSETRQCTVVRELRFGTGKPCALVKLSPAVIGQPFDLGEDLEYFVLASRHEGGTLYPAGRSPSFVHIARILDEAVHEAEEIDASQLQSVAWGELYLTREDADAHKLD